MTTLTPTGRADATPEEADHGAGTGRDHRFPCPLVNPGEAGHWSCRVMRPASPAA